MSVRNMSVRQVGGQWHIFQFAASITSFLKSFFWPFSFEHASLRIAYLHLQKGHIAFYINFPTLAVNPLTPNTYFALQSFPRSAAIRF